MLVEGVECVYFLTKAGATTLAKILGCDADELEHQQVTSVYHRDDWHRKYCIDFHIALNQALETSLRDLEISSIDRYFDKAGANRCRNPKARRLRAKTRVDLEGGNYLIPDVTFVLQSASDPQKRAVYSMEMCNGRNTRRVLTQIEKHLVAMRGGQLSRQYGLSRPHSLLVLFEHRGTLKAVESRLSIDEPYRQLVFLGDLEGMAEDVLRCWWRLDSGPRERVNFVTGKMVGGALIHLLA